MSTIVFLIIAGLVINVVRKMFRGQQSQPIPSQRTPHPTQTQQHQPAPAQRQTPQQSSSAGRSGSQQSAWEWMHSKESTAAQNGDAGDPEGQTLMFRDEPEEWIRPVEASVRMDLTEMRESQHELVHASVHESLHVRRDPNVPVAAARKQPKLTVSSANLAAAMMLSEVVGAPRSKRPWQPQHKR